MPLLTPTCGFRLCGSSEQAREKDIKYHHKMRIILFVKQNDRRKIGQTESQRAKT